jgi:diguanylate cyclase (GGDEF)-like protein/PAS domain S-box-containing protein
MLQNEGGKALAASDDSVALSRRGLLIETVATSVADVLNAKSATAVLPAVLARVARVVRIDRLVVVENAAGTGVPSSSLFFSWTATEAGLPAATAEAVRTAGEDPSLQEWLSPLTPVRPVFSVRRTAGAAVRRYLQMLGVVTSVMVPVMVEGRYWGRIGLEDCGSEHDWDPDDIKIMTMLAETIGAAITRDRFLAQAQQRELLLRAVNQSTTEIATAGDLHAAVKNALRITASAISAERVLVLEVHRSSVSGRETHLLRNFWHARHVPLGLQQIVANTVMEPKADVMAWLAPLRDGKAVSGNRSAATPGRLEVFEAFGSASVLLVPIMVDARYWGHLSIESCTGEREWNSAEVDAFRTLADLIGTSITQQRHQEEIAKANTIIQSSPTILYRLGGDATLPMTYISQNIAQLGHNPAELLNDPRRYREIIHPDDRAGLQNAMEALLQHDPKPGVIELRMLSQSGGMRWYENRYRPVRDENGKLAEIEGILTDITERRQSEERIALLARTDALTGAANRLIFSDRLRQAFAAAQRGAHPFAVLYLDLDRFKEVNDTLGHHAGDLLLQQVAQRLKATTRKIDVVARLGGDEFAIIQAEVSDSSAAGRLAEKLIEIVSAPYTVEGTELRIGTSIGIALWDRETPNPDSLLAQADQALYRAKHAGRGQYRFFSEEIDHETREHLALAEDLRAAIGRNELEIVYQPQVELVSGRIMGMEALLRWHHSTRGLLLPEDFLPIAEKFGIMQQVGRWTLDGACRQMSLWRQQQMSVPVVAVNVALAQIKMATEFVRDVKECLERWRLQPSDLELDVTEHVLARTTLSQSDVLVELRRLGVGIAIDDFGAKYSSLDYLRTYHVSRLKIARGMVAAADGLAGGSSMIRAILSLAAELGLDVVADGVETAHQRDLLVSASARAQGQGFYYSHAVTASESMQMLRAGVVLPDPVAAAEK